MSESLITLRRAVAAGEAELATHPVFAALTDIDRLRRFMEWHVFAVWDFVSLLKRLQRDLTCVTLPWTPPAFPNAARLINEIVLGEESDAVPGGGHLSHFELYLGAMAEVGAEDDKIQHFIGQVRAGIALEAALARTGLPPAVASFVRSTLQTALQGELDQVLGSFFFGREHIIPAMFDRLLTDWQITRADAPLFVHYLERHIAMDRDDHGPAAEALIIGLIGDDPKREEVLLTAALAAIRSRKLLWDALLEQLSSGQILDVAV